MINFELSDSDREVLAHVRENALITRKYARYYDENEHEFPPDELPEAKDFPEIFDLLRDRDELDSSLGVISMLISMGETWDDYSVRMRRGKGGLGNAALRAAGSAGKELHAEGLAGGAVEGASDGDLGARGCRAL